MGRLWRFKDTNQYAQCDGNPNYCTQLPDYLNDLNAMHEAEATLYPGKPEQQTAYKAILVELTDSTEFLLLHATAAQKAEAFLRAIGKWVD